MCLDYLNVSFIILSTGGIHSSLKKLFFLAVLYVDSFTVIRNSWLCSRQANAVDIYLSTCNGKRTSCNKKFKKIYSQNCDF